MRRKFPRQRQSAVLTLIAAGLAVLVAVVFVYRHNFGAAPTASPKPLPTIIMPGENWLGPSDITVLDGDTIRVRSRTVRLAGFDTPETGSGARCPRERELAERATEELRNLVGRGGLELRLVPCACAPGTEGTSACNFGRSCGYLRVHGQDVGSKLIAQGLAKPFVCGIYSCPSRQSWC